MFFIDIKRVIKSGFLNFRRNGVITTASVLVMTVMLSVIAGLIFLQAVLFFSLSEIQNKVDVTVYFHPGTTEVQIFNLKESIDTLPEVDSSFYISAEEALVNFRERHANDYLTLQALDELDENPLGGSLNIKAKELSQYEGIANFLEGDSALVKDNALIVDTINYNQNRIVIDRLNSIIDGARRLGIVFTLLLILISILITFNTIRLAIHMSREEIKVMRLVGATNRYIRGPFIVQGVLYGIISTILALILLYPVTLWIGNNMTQFLSLNIFSYYTSNFFQILVILLLSGAFIGVISSIFAMSKYLEEK